MTYKNNDTVVAKITKYFIEDDIRHPKITEHNPAWVVGKFCHSAHYNIKGEVILIIPELTKHQLNTIRGWDGAIRLTNTIDEWEIVPEDQWPDEVCVALAKRALLGEDSGRGQ